MWQQTKAFLKKAMETIKPVAAKTIEAIQQVATKTWDFVKKTVPGLFITTVAVDAALLASGNSTIIAGALSGIAAVLSITFILFGFSPQTRKKVVRFLAKYGNYIDMVLTVLLTLIGFSVSVTMGLTALFIGVNISGTMALLRFIDSWSR